MATLPRVVNFPTSNCYERMLKNSTTSSAFYRSSDGPVYIRKPTFTITVHANGLAPNGDTVLDPQRLQCWW